MSTTVLSNGTSYYIPQSDLSFFTELAERMKWKIVSKVKKANKAAKLNSEDAKKLFAHGYIGEYELFL